jgi:hypothetical protein
MSPAEQAAFDQQARELAELAKLQATYKVKLQQALNFAGKQEDGATWNGLFLMGLAMNGLDLIPYSADITPQPYWRQCPEPKGGTGEWQLSWVAEVDAFTRRGYT